MTRELHMGAARAGLSVAVDVRLVRAEYIRISRTIQPTGLRSAILAIYSRVRGLPTSVDFPSFSVFACIYVFKRGISYLYNAGRMPRIQALRYKKQLQINQQLLKSTHFKMHLWIRCFLECAWPSSVRESNHAAVIECMR